MPKKSRNLDDLLDSFDYSELANMSNLAKEWYRDKEEFDQIHGAAEPKEVLLVYEEAFTSLSSEDRESTVVKIQGLTKIESKILIDHFISNPSELYARTDSSYSEE